jgi:hypothetical protein
LVLLSSVATPKSGAPNATGTREKEAKEVEGSGNEEARDRSLERAFGIVEYYLPPIFPAT